MRLAITKIIRRNTDALSIRAAATAAAVQRTRLALHRAENTLAIRLCEFRNTSRRVTARILHAVISRITLLLRRICNRNAAALHAVGIPNRRHRERIDAHRSHHAARLFATASLIKHRSLMNRLRRNNLIRPANALDAKKLTVILVRTNILETLLRILPPRAALAKPVRRRKILNLLQLLWTRCEPA